MEADHTSAQSFTVVVCTRNRPAILDRTLNALDRQTYEGFDVLVVDQSDGEDALLARRARENTRLDVARDDGRGASRARNLAWRSLVSEWIVYLDDDCVPEPDWAFELARALRAHPEASFVTGFVGARNQPPGDYLTVTTFPISDERLHSGRWTRPWDIGFGVCMAVRRSAVEEVGGWDERLGPGVRDFPAADDMDFNYRLLRAGKIAYAAPSVRAFHEQWRTPTDLLELYRGYMAAWAGFALKHMRTGDVPGGLWLWLLGLRDPLKMFASAARRRSRFRLRMATARLAGYAAGTWKGARREW